MWPFNEKKVIPTGGVLGGVKPKPIKLQAKQVEQHETWADRIDWACAKFKAKYEIRRSLNEVTVRLSMDEGDTIINGKGPTTAAAVERAIAKLVEARDE